MRRGGGGGEREMGWKSDKILPLESGVNCLPPEQNKTDSPDFRRHLASHEFRWSKITEFAAPLVSLAPNHYVAAINIAVECGIGLEAVKVIDAVSHV